MAHTNKNYVKWIELPMVMYTYGIKLVPYSKIWNTYLKNSMALKESLLIQFYVLSEKLIKFYWNSKLENIKYLRYSIFKKV